MANTNTVTSSATAPVHDDILTMPLDELRRRTTTVLGLIAQADDLLPGLLELPEDVRRHSSHYRDHEAEALTGLLDVADEKPALFEVLADQDHGVDPMKFEPGILRDRLARVIILAPLVVAAAKFASPLGDTCMHLGNLTRPVLLAMYAIVKPHATRNAAIGTRVKAILDLYSAIGRAGAATRKAKKVALAETAAPSKTPKT